MAAPAATISSATISAVDGRTALSVAPGASNADTIFFFVSAEDRIVLDGTVHVSSGPSGRFTAGDARFAENSSGTAQDSSDRVVYNTGTGELWYDADGNGAGGRQLIATLVGAPTLGASNMEVINGSSGGGGGGSTINGTSGNDTLTGTSGNDTISGFGGNDLILAGSTGGADVIDGGTGSDSIEFKERATSAVVVDFVAGTISGGSSGTISFTNIERVVGGNFNDRLSGNGAGQTLTGQAGADTLWGAGGIDTLWGGAGADTFIFRETGTGNADLVRDWASGSDKLLLDGAVMSALGATGNFAAGDARFKANSTGTATDASDRVIYNTSNGQVWYDADGNGAGARQLIATLQSGATLVASDIAVEGGSSGGGQTINGTSGNDSLVGSPGNDTINGFGGNDTLDGLAGDDRLFGGAGDDLLRDADNFDDPGNDTLDGGLGNDTYDLRAFPFADHNPVLVDAGGIDTVLIDHDFVLPDGFDNLELFEGSVGRGNALNNVIVTHTNEPGLYSVDGADGNDTLLGGSDQDTFLFAAGSGNYGNDVVDGGNHFDVLSLFGARSAVVVDGRAGIITGGGIGGSGSVRYSNVEQIVTGSFDDRLIAHDGVTWEDPNGVHFSGPFLFAAAGNDTLTGGAADDVLQGGEGNDLISSGGDNDTLIGGSGNDRFLFDVAPGAANSDFIQDFAPGSDKIVLDGRVDLASGQSGNFTAGDARFAANSQRHRAGRDRPGDLQHVARAKFGTTPTATAPEMRSSSPIWRARQRLPPPISKSSTVALAVARSSTARPVTTRFPARAATTRSAALAATTSSSPAAPAGLM